MDNELLTGVGWRGNKRILWHDIKQVQQDGYGVRLIDRQWFGGTPFAAGVGSPCGGAW
jgi:hypothetical protein